MNHRFQFVLCWIIAATMLVSGPWQTFIHAQEKAAPQAQPAWTLDEAMGQLHLYPQDAYLQYVVLQLARRENRLEEVTDYIERLTGNAAWAQVAERRSSVDLFSIFTGALAVQESLQLDTMRAVRGDAPPRSALSRLPPEYRKDIENSPELKKQYEQQEREELAAWQKQQAVLAQRRKVIVPIASLTGPTIKSHPWEQMLAGRKPEVSALARAVPEDFYFVEFHSLSKLLEAADNSDLWGTHLFNQAYREARTHNVGEQLKQQLALETTPLLRPFYDLVVDEVAITGSDLFLREGSDVTLLFQVKQPEVFKARLDSFLANAEKARPDAKRTAGRYLDVDYVHLATPEREINVFAADPAPGLHVRSNSLAAFQRVLGAIRGKTANGQTVRRLGESAEMAYIRTLMPRGAKEEDGFVYLSDPFIRHLVGPQLKLTERRRILCYNHLRMIGHAALLYRTEYGKPPDSIETLAKTNCAPGIFGTGKLVCPSGGKYSLSADGTMGLCSHHGSAHFLTPNCEIPVTQANGEEADEYKVFLEAYNQYWRTFFDPIALRLQITPQRYQLETIVLPLIDNSIYTGLAMALGGQAEPLDALPVPKRNIFSFAARINKEPLMASIAGQAEEFKKAGYLSFLGISDQAAERMNVMEFFSKGLGNQIGLHVYDASPMFDLNLPSLLGEIAGSFNGRARSIGTTELLIGFAAASLNAPVYLSLPVQDTEVVDRFMKEMDTALALTTREREHGGFGFEKDFYMLPLNAEQTARSYGVRFGPLKLRFFWARIGGAFYIASKPFILTDLTAAEAERAKAAPQQANALEASSHALVRMRPQNWNAVLPDFRLGWAENNREACLNNLGPLSSVARAFTAQAMKPTGGASQSEEERGQEAHQYADRLQAVHYFCPEGGRYLLSPDGKMVKCSVHGTALSPQQPAAPAESSALGKLLRDFADLKATLTFLEDGLHAVVTIERK